MRIRAVEYTVEPEQCRRWIHAQLRNPSHLDVEFPAPLLESQLSTKRALSTMPPAAE